VSKQPQADRRRNRRTGKLRHLRVSLEGGPLGEHRISDVSTDGLFINTSKPLAAGKSIRLVLEAPGGEIRTLCVVRHAIAGKGMGVEFAAMQEHDRERLKALIEAVESQESRNVATVAEVQSDDSALEDADPSQRTPRREEAGGEKTPKPIAKGAERRRERRRRFSARAEVIESESGATIEARIRDLSRGGCYVDTKRPFALGSVVRLTVSRKQGSFTAQARVVYAETNKGMGLIFEAIAPEQLEVVDRWLGESDWVASARRGSQRLVARMKVRVSGEDSTGARFDEETYTRTVSELGGLIPLSAPVDEGQRLVLVNAGTDARLECRVAYVGRSEGDSNPIGLTFLLPNPRFWNVMFPPSPEPTENDEATDVDQDEALRRVARAIAEEAPNAAQRRPSVAAEIPVRLLWQDGDERSSAEAITVNVSATGALLAAHQCAGVGKKIILINSVSGEQIDCLVRYARRSESGPGEVRLEFVKESATFWGANILPDEQPTHREAEPRPKVAPSPKPRESRAALKALIKNESTRIAAEPSAAPAKTGSGLLSKHWRTVAGAGLAFVCVLAWAIWSSTTTQGPAASSPAISQPSTNLAGLAPEEASLIPDSAGYRLAKEQDFDPDAASWLSSLGVQVSGDIPGEYSGSGESHAYILKATNGDWRVVIVVDGQLHCDAHYKSVGIAARVPKAALNSIFWKNASKFDSEGDGLLIVRSASDASSGVVLLLAGDQVTSGAPSDYHQVPLR
jgi:hypothetical protein